MGKKLAILHVLVGALILCNGTPLEKESFSTAASVSESTVTSKSVTELLGNRRKNVSAEEEISNGEEISFSASADEEKMEKPSQRLAEDSVAKLQKAKKKILNSNAKASGEKSVLPSDKREKQNLLKNSPGATTTEGHEVTKHSGKDTLPESVTLSLEGGEKTTGSVQAIRKNQSVVDKEEEEKRRKKNGVVESRSLDGGSSRENVSTDREKKTRIFSSTTEQTTIGLTSETSVGDPEKFVGSDKEEYGRRIESKFAQTSASAISKNDSLKNVIRFEPAVQANRASFPLNQSPSSLPPVTTENSMKQMMKSSLNGSEESWKSTDGQTIAFPSDGGGNQSEKKSNSVAVLPEGEQIQRTTEKLEVVAEKPKAEEEEDEVGKSPPVQFDSGKPNAAAAAESKKYQMETNPKRNFSMENSEMEIPATGASWTLATLRSSTSAKSTEKPETREKDEESVVAKEQNQELKNTIPDTVIGDSDLSPGKQNASHHLDKAVDAWTSMKTIVDEGDFVNETEVVIPGSVDSGQVKIRPTPLDGKLPKATTTTIVIATEKTAMTKSPQKPITIPGASTIAEDSTLFSSTSRSSVVTKEGYLLPFATTRRAMGDESSPPPTTTTTTIATTESLTASPETTSTDGIPFSTTPKLGSFEETNGEDGGDTSTEVEPKHFLEEDKKESVQNFSTTRVPVVAETTEYSNATTTEFPSNATDDKTTETALAGVNISTPISSDSYAPSTIETMSKTTSFGLMGVEITTASTSSTSLTLAGKTMVVTAASPMGTPTTAIAMETTGRMTAGTVASTPSNFSTGRATTDEFSVAEANKTTPSNPASFATPTPTATATPTPAPDVSLSTRRVATSSSRPETTITASTTALPDAPVTFEVAAKPGERTEESIYYQNYVPTTMDPREEITEENVPAYLRLTVQTSSWTELCTLKESLRDSILKMLNGKNVSSEFVHFLNLNERNCREKMRETGSGDENGTVFLPVNMFLMDKNGDFDKNLSEAFLTLWGRHGLDFDLPIRKVDFVTPIVNLTELTEPPLGGSVVAAIVISCVAGICVILLGILFVIMKRRQKRFNYGQRCTPVSLDAYSLDSVSVYNSVRRKGHRASKRSYGNAAFDDPEVPSHPVNFAGLANFSSGKEQLYEEFGIIPQVHPKAEELPEGAETKNRYANVIPLPETRVHLTVREGDPLSDYINANYVRGGKGAEKLYIACQGPMQSTVEDFWRMIWEQQCKVILMITDLQENGMEKCVDYLPPNEVTDNLRLFGDYQVTLKKRDVKEKYIISNLTLKNMETNLWREVTHLWYLGWPDQGVPSEANSLIAFLIEARSQMKIQNGGNNSSPAVVHCSPGTGRTGTVIACDLCIREYEQTRMVDIPKCVFNLRRDRAGAVQTKDQYAFIYQVLNVYATKLTGGGIESI